MDVDSQPDLPKKRRSDFMPGEVLFLVEHSDKLSQQEIKYKLLEDPAVAGNEQITAAINQAKAGRVITFGRVPKPVRFQLLKRLFVGALRLLDSESRVNSGETAAPYFSVVFTTFKKNDKEVIPDDELIGIVRTLDKKIVGRQFNRRRRTLEPKRRISRDIPLAQDVSPSRPLLTEIPYRPEFVLMAASPNWAMGGGQSQLVTGGPGGRPEPTTPGVRVTPPNVSYPDIPVPPQAEGPDAPLDVYILDTVPTLMGDEIKTDPAGVNCLLKAAYKKWVDDKPLGDKHELMSTLLEPDGTGFKRLDISMDDCRRDDGRLLMEYMNDHLTGTAIRGHEYYMTDHGLFVASIIHRDLPEADLHLVQVLNDYGVGTIETLLRGMQKVIQNYHGNPTIVNCSLMMDIPRIGHPINTDSKTVAQMLDELRNEITPLERMGWFIEWACDLLTDLGIMVVASAGNDAQGDPRPQARYPAAFESVIGIAAAGSDGNPASYANLADDPEYEGFITFGGDAAMVSQNGTRVLGVYIGNFPDGTRLGIPCEDGWAYWAGSSFAAPAISGLLGRFRRKGFDRNATMQHIFTGAQKTNRDKEPIIAQKQ